MNEHTELMEQMHMTRSEYLAVLRKDQPLAELRRKAVKSARRKGNEWTQEQIDLCMAEAINILINAAT